MVAWELNNREVSLIPFSSPLGFLVPCFLSPSVSPFCFFSFFIFFPSVGWSGKKEGESDTIRGCKVYLQAYSSLFLLCLRRLDE